MAAWSGEEISHEIGFLTLHTFAKPYITTTQYEASQFQYPVTYSISASYHSATIRTILQDVTTRTQKSEKIFATKTRIRVHVVLKLTEKGERKEKQLTENSIIFSTT